MRFLILYTPGKQYIDFNAEVNMIYNYFNRMSELSENKSDL